ncbi:MAG: hypothetical protein ACFNLD_04720 [Kingella oralis]
MRELNISELAFVAGGGNETVIYNTFTFHGWGNQQQIAVSQPEPATPSAPASAPAPAPAPQPEPTHNCSLSGFADSVEFGLTNGAYTGAIIGLIRRGPAGVIGGAIMYGLIGAFAGGATYLTRCKS